MPFVAGVEPIVFPARAPEATTWPTANPGSLAIPLARARVLALAFTVIVALAFRTVALSTYGFSEDEINKVQAIQQYRAGHFVANAEHPMLMKLAMWGSVAAADAWNRIAPVDEHVSLRSEEHTSELQSHDDISYAVFCLKTKKSRSSRSRRTPDRKSVV